MSGARTGLLEAIPPAARCRGLGGRRSDREEIEDAPAAAHVKRTARGSLDSAAFVLRRSMPGSDAARGGRVLMAFHWSGDACETQCRCMRGLQGGNMDALFRFTRPRGGACFWYRPMQPGGLHRPALGL